MSSHISAIPEISWPAIPAKPAAHALSLLSQFEKSQWWPPEEIALQQFRQLSDLLSHADKTIPFYHERFKDAGVKLQDISGPEQLRGIPPLTRNEVNRANRALLSRALPKSHGGVYATVTSGSSGSPVKVYNTSLNAVFFKAFVLRNLSWHKRDLSQKLATIRVQEGDVAMYPRGEMLHNWGPLTGDVYRTGPVAVLNIKTPIHEQAEWLCRQDPGYLSSYPSNIHMLAKHFKKEGLQLPGLLAISTLGEILGPEVRQICREVWNVPIADMYSSQEVGYIGLQCPEHEHYHVQSENIIVEVVTGDNKPCKPGEIGRILITTLHNYAMPLIRYDIGDYGEVGQPCDCGRGLPVLTRIMGRQRQMFRLPDGSYTWPVLPENSGHNGGFSKDGPTMSGLEVIRELIRQFQVIQRSLRDVELRLAVARPLAQDEEKFVKEYFQEACGYPFHVTITYLDSIPRDAGEKYEEFKSDLL